MDEQHTDRLPEEPAADQDNSPLVFPDLFDLALRNNLILKDE